MSAALRLDYGGSLLSLQPGEKAHIACDAGQADILLRHILAESCETPVTFCRAEPALLADLTVWENVALPLALRGQSLRRAKPAALEVLKALEVGHAAHALPGRLTDFEQRQAALARGLIGEPHLFLLADIAGGLHAVESLRLYDLLTRQAAYQNAAALFLGGLPPPESVHNYVLQNGILCSLPATLSPNPSPEGGNVQKSPSPYGGGCG